MIKGITGAGALFIVSGLFLPKKLRNRIGENKAVALAFTGLILYTGYKIGESF